MIYPGKPGTYASLAGEGAHRLVWSALVGPIPDGWWVIDHLCYQKRCLNVDHMEVVTMMENSRRSALRRWDRDRIP